MHLYLKNVSDEPLDIIKANECEGGEVSLTQQRFRRLWNEYERLRVRLNERNTYGIAFDTERYPGYVHAVKITMSEDVMQDSDVCNVNLADHPNYKLLQQYVKANPR
jgi:hypothetical protein